MRPDPLSYLSTELDSLKSQGLYRHLRILEGEQQARTTFDHTSVVNLSRGLSIDCMPIQSPTRWGWDGQVAPPIVRREWRG